MLYDVPSKPEVIAATKIEAVPYDARVLRSREKTARANNKINASGNSLRRKYLARRALASGQVFAPERIPTSVQLIARSSGLLARPQHSRVIWHRLYLCRGDYFRF